MSPPSLVLNPEEAAELIEVNLARLVLVHLLKAGLHHLSADVAPEHLLHQRRHLVHVQLPTPVGVQLLELRLQLARILAVEELDDLVQLSVEALPVALGLLLRDLTRQLAQNPVEAAAVARAREPRAVLRPPFGELLEIHLARAVRIQLLHHLLE